MPYGSRHFNANNLKPTHTNSFRFSRNFLQFTYLFFSFCAMWSLLESDMLLFIICFLIIYIFLECFMSYLVTRLASSLFFRYLSTSTKSNTVSEKLPGGQLDRLLNNAGAEAGKSFLSGFTLCYRYSLTIADLVTWKELNTPFVCWPINRKHSRNIRYSFPITLLKRQIKHTAEARDGSVTAVTQT